MITAYDINSKEDLMRAAHEDPKFIIESGFYVVNKEKETVPFIFNLPQDIFYEERTTRDDLLKAGQLGISTEILAILTVKFLLVPNSWSVCISHQDEATKRLFERVDFFLQHLPPWLKQFYIPGKTTEGDIVNQAMNSKFYVGTAGARAFGRGDTIHYAHFSEVSRWKDAGKVLTNVLRAVPLNDPHTWIVKETTANGQGNLHHIEYTRAKNGQGKFRSHFLPWFSNPDYRIEDHTLTEDQLNPEEKKLLLRFPEEDKQQNKGWISLASLAWRREMIGTLVSEDGRTPEEMFKQEFPSDDQEAFLFSGNPVFPMEQVENYKPKAPTPIFVGNLEGIAPNVSLDSTPQGWLKLYKKPMLGSQYIIFADVGQFSDFCSAHVIAKKSWRIVATFHANIKAHHFGDELNKLGHYFNKAEIAVEVNNMGQSTIDRLVQLNYPHLYMRERLNQKDKKVTLEYGWHTTEKSKALILGHMQNLLRTEQVPYIDMETIGEISTFVRHDDGSMGASEGNNDDRVISFCGAYYILKLHPFKEVQQKVLTNNQKVQKFKQFRTNSVRRMNRWRR